MFKALFAALALFVSAPAFAYTYSCEVLDYEDYAVEVSFVSNKAALFDNNEWSVVDLVTPPKGESTLFGFEGVDYTGAKLGIVFDDSEGGYESTVTFEVDGKVVTQVLGCSSAKPEELLSGI